MGIAIVFAALLLISFFIAVLPLVLKLLTRVLPAVGADSADSYAIDERVVAAIGYVLRQRELEKDEQP